MTLSVYALTGLAPVESNHAAAPTERGSAGDVGGLRALVNPSNPLLWFGGLLAVTFGLVGVSGSARLGRAKASASLNKA